MCWEIQIVLNLSGPGWRVRRFLMLDGHPVSVKEAAKVKIVPVHDKDGRKPTEDGKTSWKTTLRESKLLKAVMDKPLDISCVQCLPKVFSSLQVFVFSSMWLIMPKYLLTAAHNLLSEGFHGTDRFVRDDIFCFSVYSPCQLWNDKIWVGLSIYWAPFSQLTVSISWQQVKTPFSQYKWCFC